MGEPRISPVYSVGSSGSTPGGVVEAAMLSVWRLAVADFLSGGGARRSSAADLLPGACSKLPGAAVRVFPPPGADERRTWESENKEGVSVLIQGDDDGGAGWRLRGAEDRRLPVRRRALSDPSHLGRSSGGAPAARPVLLCQRRGPEGLLCNFRLFLDLSVMDLVSI